jgi:hypothetical protein
MMKAVEETTCVFMHVCMYVCMYVGVCNDTVFKIWSEVVFQLEEDSNIVEILTSPFSDPAEYKAIVKVNDDCHVWMSKLYVLCTFKPTCIN